MEITLNGKKVKIAGANLTSIISEHKINPNNCIVELNGKFIEKDDYYITQLHEGDCLELIRFIGGG